MPARPSRRFGPWVGPASPPHLFCETNPFCGAPRAVQPRHLRQQRKRARHAVCSQDMGNGCYQDIGYTLPIRQGRNMRIRRDAPTGRLYKVHSMPCTYQGEAVFAPVSTPRR